VIEIQVFVPEYDKKVSKKIKIAVAKCLELTSVHQKTSLSISIGNNEFIQELNKTYRKVDRPTDVLSFTEDYMIPDTEVRYLGDIAMSYPMALSQANDAGHPVEEELILLAIHGTLHLLGYDHHSEEQKTIMWDLQHQVLEAVGINMINFSGDN
jgi:probable rRNA maturation factor